MFSVAIPIYNHARYLRKAIYSCLAAPLVREILLVDDGSTDDSAIIAHDLASAYPDRIKNLTDSPSVNRGAHNRLNQLCAAASQPWIAILNSDDYFPAHRFDLIRLIARTEGCDFVSGGMLIVDDNDAVIGTKRGILQPEYPCPLTAGLDGPLRTDDLRLLLCSQNFIATTSNIAFRKSLFEKIGGFADLRYAHDWDFALRATMLGKCFWSPNFLTCYRVHHTNTIKELSPQMDGEIVRFFYRFLEDYPAVECDPHVRTALEANRHIAPYVARPAGSWDTNHINDRPPFRSLLPRLSRRAALNALLGLAHRAYDFVALSSELDEPPLISLSSLETAIVFRAEAAASSAPARSPKRRDLRGRIMRIPVPAASALSKQDIRSLPDWGDARVEGANVYVGEPSSDCPQPPPEYLEELKRRLDHPRDKPTCLVLPIFMAVGGVERNTIEMIRELRRDYHFVVVTTERLAKSQGSLHYQLDELEVPTLDLAEVADPEFHLELLASIADLVLPNLVWICNGSPWLVEHALALRRLFWHVPIVDQQVYDTEFGWINEYHRKGIQSFDHFIAINACIRKKFIRELRIPEHRISLIYSAINPTKITSGRVGADKVVSARQEMGLPVDAPHLFAFVGRLTDQKQPLLFLELARESMRRGLSDQFILVGDGDLGEQCQSFIATHGLTNVTRIPFCAQTARLLSVVDGLLVPSKFEGLPIVMLESLAVGTPVFATDVGDIRLIMEDYGAGVVTSPTMTAAEAWQEFSGWRERLTQYKERARAAQDAVLDRFSSATLASAYRNCFTACVQAYEDRPPLRG